MLANILTLKSVLYYLSTYILYLATNRVAKQFLRLNLISKSNKKLIKEYFY
jgi:hypothetical protein